VEFATAPITAHDEPGVTIGIEEEFLLVDPDTWQVTARATQVLAEVPEELRPCVSPEFHQTMIEIATPVCSGLDELREWLRTLRGAVADAAERAGCRLLAAGTSVLGPGAAAPLTRGARYDQMAVEFGALVEVQGLCATHVHVGVPNRELAVMVNNRLREHLPLLHALCVNSPIVSGRDTGYSSWRSISWARWPTVGPAPRCRSAEHYDETLARLVHSGTILDERMAYWYNRLSSRYPTVEVRVGDVCPTLDESILVAALSRALVNTVIAEHRAGVPEVEIDDHMLRAAHWRAARDGIEGLAIDFASGGLRPAWEMLDALVDRLSPALELRGDLATVRQLVGNARRHGSGAYRQRLTFAAAGLAGVVAYLVAETRRDTGPA
jgi:carboxylate-amine ligase